jgi:hypothetical protein
MDNSKLLLVLYGKARQGKTTTLMNLAIRLAGGGPVMEKKIRAIFKNKNRTIDNRIIIEYKDQWIYIATGGDSWNVCKVNCNFFEKNFDSKLNIYLIDASGLRSLSLDEKKKFNNHTPKVVVSACRPDGDEYGAIKAIHSYNEKHILKYTEQLWIRKEKSFESTAMADELQKRIEEFIKK